QNNLTLKPNKCHFAVQEVEYLEHIISKSGIRPNSNKTEVIETYPMPKDKTQLRRFLGTANYYKRFIQGYS
ncbi:Retrovirus-related Pol polyprotein from transposon 17.6, partial [Lamellibrachia satsuma]